MQQVTGSDGMQYQRLRFVLHGEKWQWRQQFLEDWEDCEEVLDLQLVLW